MIVLKNRKIFPFLGMTASIHIFSLPYSYPPYLLSFHLFCFHEQNKTITFFHNLNFRKLSNPENKVITSSSFFWNPTILFQIETDRLAFFIIKFRKKLSEKKNSLARLFEMWIKIKWIVNSERTCWWKENNKWWRKLNRYFNCMVLYFTIKIIK